MWSVWEQNRAPGPHFVEGKVNGAPKGGAVAGLLPRFRQERSALSIENLKIINHK